MAMGGEDGPVDIRNVVNQVFDLPAILLWQGVTCCIGDVHYRGPGIDHRFDNPGQVFVIRPACILSIEFHIFNETLRIFHRLDRSFQDLFGITVQLW